MLKIIHQLYFFPAKPKLTTFKQALVRWSANNSHLQESDQGRIFMTHYHNH